MSNPIVPTHLNLTFDQAMRYEALYHDGYLHGKGFADANVPTVGDKVDKAVDYWGLGPVITEENAAQYHEMLAGHAEIESRQYSPFEVKAKELNEDQVLGSELAWEAFELGIYTVIAEDVKKYFGLYRVVE